MIKKKRSLVVANWKMNPESAEEAKSIADSIKRFTTKLKRTDVVMAPSFIHIPLLSKIFTKNKKVFLGAQNCHYKNLGAYTGEVSPSQLKEFGVKYVIIGHSERRAAGETGEIINSKIKNVLANGLTPILCIGEKQRDKDGAYLEFVRNQIKECLAFISKKDLMSIIIAYEPVWAIGKSWRESMGGTDMHEMSLFIKKSLSEMFGEDYGWNVKILYGGSVEPENTLELMEKGEISGFLVGHASLETDRFKEILKITDK